MTKDWLNKHNIYYDQLILTNAYNKHEKADKCIENKIDIIINTNKILLEFIIGMKYINTYQNIKKKSLMLF